MKTKKTSDDSVLISSKDEYDDDCPVCQIMKRMEDGEEVSKWEIREAFKASKEKGGIVGFAEDEDEGV